MSSLRAADWINLLVFSWLLALAIARPGMDHPRRAKIVAIGLAGLGITLFSVLVLPHLASPLSVSISRDWIPYLLLLMFYWQAGQFVTHTDAEIEARLARVDKKVVAPLLRWCASRPIGAWILNSLELAYLFCYISLPLGLVALYVLGERRHANLFWNAILLSTYPCYGILPFAQTRPPRSLDENWSRPLPSGKVRAFNIWILRHASVHANTIPSAHVASTMACALILSCLAPVWVGLTFLIVAIGIALGAVAGRYHYAADAVLGVALAEGAFLLEDALLAHRLWR